MYVCMLYVYVIIIWVLRRIYSNNKRFFLFVCVCVFSRPLKKKSPFSVISVSHTADKIYFIYAHIQ